MIALPIGPCRRPFPAICRLVVSWAALLASCGLLQAQDSLVCGQMTGGGIGKKGQTNFWTFSADAGDAVIVRMGDLVLTGTNSLDSLMQIFTDDKLIAQTGDYATRANELAFYATNGGAFDLRIIGVGNPGDYRLNLATTGCAMAGQFSGEGGVLTNGFQATGALDVGTLDTWTFEANTGDGLFIRMGNTSTNGVLDPYLRLFGPDGKLLAQNGGYGNVAEDVSIQAPTNGTFVVVINGGGAPFGRSGGSGEYRVTLVDTAHPISTAPGDEGGALTNGFMQTGYIDLGDADVWNFAANAGDGILVRMGNSSTNGTLDPYLRLYAPDGKLAAPVVGDYGFKAEEIATRATATGVYTVVLSGGNAAVNGTGPYRLTLAKTGEPIVTAPDDEGGTLTNGYTLQGYIDLGDVDAWTVPAQAGDSIVVRMGVLSNTNTWLPQLRLWGPDGKLLQDEGGYGSIAQEVTTRATEDGTFLVTLNGGNAAAGGTGQYRITLAQTGSPIAVAADDESGLLPDEEPQTGTLPTGDLDVWSFPVTTNSSPIVTLLSLSDDNRFLPWLRLYGPDGKLAFSQFGGTNIVGTFKPSDDGLATVVVADAGKGYAQTTSYSLALLNNILITLTGHVYCVCDTNPIASASIQIGTNSLTSGASGAYVLSNLVAGPYTGIVTATDYFPLTNQFTLDPNQLVQTNDFYLTNRTLVIAPKYDEMTITAGPYAPSDIQKITNSIQAAIDVYRHTLANPMCVKIVFQATGDPQAFADSQVIPEIMAYSDYLTRLRANPEQSPSDTVALAHLPPGPNTGINGNKFVKLTHAIQEAIGAAGPLAPGDYHGLITFNFSKMNLSRADPIDPSKNDLQSTALHEIDEVLGIGGSGSTLALKTAYTGQASPTDAIGPLDLFRYSTNGQRSFTLDPSQTAYFSIDGGRTELVFFNQLEGDDFGDWGTGNLAAEVQDAVGGRGIAPDLGNNELTALDVVGYTLLSTPPTIQTLIRTGDTFTFGVSSLPGQIYQAQFASDLSQSAWNDLGSSVVANDFTITFSDLQAVDAKRFYRVLKLPSKSQVLVPSLPPEPVVTADQASLPAQVERHYLRERPMSGDAN